MGRWAFILGPSRAVNFHTPQLYHFAKKAPGRDAKKCRCSRLDAVSHQVLSLSLSQNGGGPRDMGIATGWIPGSRLWDKRWVCKKYYRKFSWDQHLQGMEESRRGQREKFVWLWYGSKEGAADLSGSFEGRMALQSCPELGQRGRVFISPCEPVIGWGLPWARWFPSAKAIPREGSELSAVGQLPTEQPGKWALHSWREIWAVHHSIFHGHQQSLHHVVWKGGVEVEKA